MMYRRHAAQHSAKSIQNIAAKTETMMGSLKDFFATLISMGVFAQAERENRKFTRVAKRQNKHNSYLGFGLNGPRAMERRRRQIANGSLRRENGLADA